MCTIRDIPSKILHKESKSNSVINQEPSTFPLISTNILDGDGKVTPLSVLYQFADIVTSSAGMSKNFSF